ncbi:putative MFS transporter Liz1/Seo1 [Lophiostoma macrostomum CBS 122681]|uniref:Putative MFS transporter Liz1/Seo1 n=1 Tax=Lophiostoma macrostomum CBS 122681 TaxID=1314788 RepID=A0A6A6SLY1_9PLEO|nr:putative MFS transporter Liz1/Seo1 [Lophiostoma macrostomum CBS 122681]
MASQQQSSALENELAERAVKRDVTKRRWVNYVWDTLDKPKEERRFLFKLDAALLSYACFSFFIKFLDQVNINNAFVSGMKEDLGLFGNQLNYMQTCWTVGYIIIWSVLTFTLCRAKTATHIYVIRFFVGLFESSFYPGLQYIIGSWYRKDELAKRTCIFHVSSVLGAMFSGYLMAAVYHLDGVHGYKGWQWLFIIDGVISLPIALVGFWLIPDVPEISKPWYLTENEVMLAQKRMELEGRKPRGKYTIAKVKRILTSWHIYTLVLVSIFWANGVIGAAAPAFQLFLKASKKYSVPQINALGTVPFAVQAATTLIFAWLSDGALEGARWPPIIFGGLLNIILGASLAAWDVADGWKWACFALAGISGASGGLFFAWANEICSRDSEERAIVIASMNTLSYVVQVWLPLIVFQQVQAPRYYKGWVTVTVLNVCLVLAVFGTWWLQRSEDEKKAQAVGYAGSDDYEKSEVRGKAE